MNRFDKLAREHPLVHLMIFGFGGMTVIIAVLDGMFYLIGGNRLVDALDIVTVLCGVAWAMMCWIRVRPYISK